MVCELSIPTTRMLMNKSTKHQPAPETFDDPVALKEQIFTMLHGDDYWHDRIKRVLAAAGFITRRIEQLDSHPVWTMHLPRTTFDLAADNPTAAKQIRKLLCKAGIKILRNELSIVSRNRDWIRCAFILELGAPGVLN
jgi:hypothetical protein